MLCDYLVCIVLLQREGDATFVLETVDDFKRAILTSRRYTPHNMFTYAIFAAMRETALTSLTSALKALFAIPGDFVLDQVARLRLDHVEISVCMFDLLTMGDLLKSDCAGIDVFSGYDHCFVLL